MSSVSKKRYLNELKSMKNERLKLVLLTAKDLFFKQGIEATTFNQIAAETEIGVASIYRYYKNKQDLAIGVAELAAVEHIEWEKKQLKNVPLDGSGKDQLKELLMLFAELYEKRPEYICFLLDFDSYVQKKQIPVNKLIFYEEILQQSGELFHRCFKQGFEDGSIRKELDIDLIVRTITLSLVSLSQKLLLRGNIVESDKALRGVEHLKCLIDMCVESVSG